MEALAMESLDWALYKNFSLPLFEHYLHEEYCTYKNYVVLY